MVTSCITPSLHKRCWELGLSGVQSCVAAASSEKRPELPASLFSPPLPPGFLHSERQDHWEEGCCCTVWGLLPHHRNAELWGESQSGPAPLEWLGTFPIHQPLLPLLPLYRTRSQFLTSLRISSPEAPRVCSHSVPTRSGPCQALCAHVSDLVPPLSSVPGP